MKIGFIKQMMQKGIDGKKGNIWEYVCRWLIAWGIGAHVITAFLIVMALT